MAVKQQQLLFPFTTNYDHLQAEYQLIKTFLCLCNTMSCLHWRTQPTNDVILWIGSPVCVELELCQQRFSVVSHMPLFWIQNEIPSDATSDVRAQRILVIVTRSGIKVCVQLKVKVGRTWGWRKGRMCEFVRTSRALRQVIPQWFLRWFSEPWKIFQSFRDSLGISMFSQMEAGWWSLEITLSDKLSSFPTDLCCKQL